MSPTASKTFASRRWPRRLTLSTQRRRRWRCCSRSAPEHRAADSRRPGGDGHQVAHAGSCAPRTMGIGCGCIAGRSGPQHGPEDRAGLQEIKEVDMAASDQLNKLRARAKEAEERVAAAQGKARADLEQDVKRARETAQADADQLHKDAEEGKGKVSAWWHDVQRSWHEHVASIREDSIARGQSTTGSEPRETPRRPRTTRCLRFATLRRRSTRPSTRCSTQPSPGRKLTNSQPRASRREHSHSNLSRISGAAADSGRNGRGHNGGRRNDSRRNGATRGGPARPARNRARRH